MIKDKKKKKVSSEGLSTKEKMLARKKQLESKGNGSGLVYPKEGTLRMRIKSPGDDQELSLKILLLAHQLVNIRLYYRRFKRNLPTLMREVVVNKHLIYGLWFMH